VIVYIVVNSGATVWLPAVGLLPLQPFEAVHELTLFELQVSTDVCPLYIVEG